MSLGARVLSHGNGYLLTFLALCVFGCGVNPSTKGVAPESAMIVIFPENGESPLQAIRVASPKDLVELESFFPNYRDFPPAQAPGGWLTGYQVYFNQAGGKAICVTVAEMGESWTMGEGDLSVQGDFPAFVERLRKSP